MFMALFTAPLGLIGVVLALNITRTPLGFMAILGIIALSGMIIRNSIILLDPNRNSPRRRTICPRSHHQLRYIAFQTNHANRHRGHPWYDTTHGIRILEPTRHRIQRRSTRSNHTNTHRTTSYVRNMV